MAGYDPKKAAEYNRLIQQGVTPEEAIVQVGITYETQGNYEINSVGTPETNNSYGKMSDIAIPRGQTSGASDTPAKPFVPVVPQTESVFDPLQEPAESVFNPGPTYNGPATQESVFDTRQDVGEHVFNPGTTYNGPATQESVFDTRQDVGEHVFNPAASLPNPAVTTAAQLNDPYAGLSPKQLQDLGGADPTDPYIRARLGIPQLPGSTLFATSGFGTIKTGVPAIDSALGIIGGGITSLFSNFSSTVGGLFGPKPTASASAATTGSGVAALTQPATGPGTRDTAVNPASDPSQFPAYDDNGYLQPGFKINEENGQPYYAGVGPATSQSAVNPASDPSQFPAFDDNGYLQPGFKINEENGQPYYAGLAGNANNASESVFDPLQDPGEHVFDPGATYNGPAARESVFDTAQDVGENVFDPGQTFNANAESVFDPAAVDVGQTGSVAGITTRGINSTTLSADQADAFYNGTGTLTADERLAVDRKTAADAAVLYPGTNNTNLREINNASAAIAQNEAGIANAQNIIAQNNAELADPNISDARRAELEANNAAQENYIRLAESNTAENELVIEANADAYATGVDTPAEVAGLTDPGIQENVFDPGVGPPQSESVFDPEQDVGENVFDPGQTFNANEESVFDPANVDLNSDPFEQARFESQQALDNQQPVEFAPEDVPVLTDQEADALAEQQAENQRILAAEATDVEPGSFAGQTDEFGGVDEAVAAQQAENVDPDQGGLELPPGAEPDEPPIAEPYALNADDDPGIGQGANDAVAADAEAQAQQASQFQGSQEQAIRNLAKQQATFQARYKQPGNADWRVRLSLAPDAQYLYNEKNGVGILAPLANTDGVIFPYTPSITTTYSAQYEQYDLVHSNYRGLFYKNSRVGDIQIRGVFTAQDTAEADYLLAVIHFFRSATKMFYGQDAQRGVPPPVCLLNGFGQYQFSDHPVVISSFNYTLPNDVDYIRAGSPNNYGINLLNRRAAVASNPGGQSLAGLNRLANALLKKGAPGQGAPDPNAIQQNVSNTAGASYVPTKMEIDITLIPVQTRTQVSKQFSLKGFANGQLLKGGFW